MLHRVTGPGTHTPQPELHQTVTNETISLGGITFQDQFHLISVLVMVAVLVVSWSEKGRG